MHCRPIIASLVTTYHSRWRRPPAISAVSAEYRSLFVKADSYHPQYSFRMVQCVKCGLCFLNPRPTVQTLAFFYPPSYYDSMGNQRARKSYRKRIVYLPRLAGQTLLDLGTGRGDFVLFLRNQGWLVEGYETVYQSPLPAYSSTVVRSAA